MHFIIENVGSICDFKWQRIYHVLRASIADVVFVLNAIIFGIWHTKHKKRSFIKCIKCVQFLQHVTVSFQF